MGYKKKVDLTLHQQAYARMENMRKIGKSKTEARANGTAEFEIFSFDTNKTYWQHIKYFLDYIATVYPEVKNLDEAMQYVKEWLEIRENELSNRGTPYSASTLHTEAKALGKLFSIKPGDEQYYAPPIRNREDFTRSRIPTESDKHFSESNNDEFIRFCKGTGCRRNVVEKLKGKDIFTLDELEKMKAELSAKEELGKGEVKLLHEIDDALEYGMGAEYYVHHRTDKGGRERFAMIFGPDVDLIVKRMMATDKEEKVWLNVPTNADIHSYRGDYATAIYRKYARKIEDIPYDAIHPGTGQKYQSEVYKCRKDEKGKRLDKRAMLIASKALGHNRISVVANNYIRGL